MDTDLAAVARGWNASGLDHAEHFLISALRRIVVRRGEACPVVAREFADACGDDRAGEALATFRVFVGVLGHTARRRISIGRPGWRGLTGDGRHILALIGAAQADDGPTLDARLSWFARHDVRHELAIVVRAIALVFAAHDLRLPAAEPAAAVTAGPLRLVS